MDLYNLGDDFGAYGGADFSAPDFTAPPVGGAAPASGMPPGYTFQPTPAADAAPQPFGATGETMAQAQARAAATREAAVRSAYGTTGGGSAAAPGEGAGWLSRLRAGLNGPNATELSLPDSATAAARLRAAGAAAGSRAVPWVAGAARAALPLTGMASAAQSGMTPTEDYRARYGLGDSGSFAGDLGVRGMGAMQDLGDTASFGLTDRFNNLTSGHGFVRTPAPRSDMTVLPPQPKDASGQYLPLVRNAQGQLVPAAPPPQPGGGVLMTPEQQALANQGLPPNGVAPVAATPQVLRGTSATAPPTGAVAGPDAVGAGITQAKQAAQDDPQGSEERADALEAHTGTDITTLFNQLMQQYGQPNLDLTRAEKGNLLMQFGLATMAAASRPGAKFAGAVGEGGLSALGAANQLRGQKIEMAQKQREASMQFLRDYVQDRRNAQMMAYQMERNRIADRRADTADRRADAYAQQAQSTAARNDAYMRYLIPAIAARDNAQAGLAGARTDNVGLRPMRNPSEYLKPAAEALQAEGNFQPTQAQIVQRAQQLMQFDAQGGFNIGATAAPPQYVQRGGKTYAVPAQ